MTAEPAHPPNIVIAIARQLGAGGAFLGERLANRLGFAYLDREILRQAAERVGGREEELSRWDERVSRFWDRLVDSFAVGPPESIYTSVPGPATPRDQELFEIETRVIRELVARRCAVVIGRGASQTLRGHPGLISILLHAPPHTRIATVRAGYKLASDQEAAAMIARVDQERERFLREMTGRAMTDARNYDLCFDTCRVGLDTAEQIVLAQVEAVRRAIGAANI